MGMKHFAVISFFAAAAFVGCAKLGSEAVETVPSEEQTENTPFIIRVDTPVPEPSATKTTFNEETYEVNWSAGDALAVRINGSETTYEFVNKTGETNEFTCADFHPTEGTTYEYDILYPYSANGQFTMSGGVKTPMHGTGTAVGSASPNVPINQLTALIKVAIKNANAVGTSTLTALRVERTDGGILGGLHTVEGPVEGNNINYTTVTAQNKKIAAGESIDMYLQCAPFTADEDMKLLVRYTVDGVEYVAEKTISKGTSFNAGTVNKTSVSFAAPDAIFIDFGSKSTTGWNNITDVKAASVELRDTKSESTGMTLSLSGDWKLQNPVGYEPERYVEFGNSQYPKSAWYDSFMLQNTSGTMVFNGMLEDAVYRFTIASYRWNGTPEARITRFELSGLENLGSIDVNQGTKDTKLSDIANHFAVFENVKPDEKGCVTLTVTPIQTDRACDAHLSAIKIERIK